MENILPDILKKGDTVAVVTLSAPDAALNRELFDRGVSYLKDKGFNVWIAPNALQSKGYMVTDCKTQVEDLHKAFSNPQIKAIFLSGGGFNANRLLPLIDYELISKHPKIIMGMSNMSVVLNAIYAKTKLITFYGPAVVFNMGNLEGLDSYSENLLWQSIMVEEPIGIIPVFTERIAIKHGKAIGKLIGGNLTSIQSLLGTPYEPIWEDSIFFWEDCFAEIHNIDMILTHFKIANVFSKISGMLVGKPLEIAEKEFSDARSLVEMISEVCDGYNFPILYNIDFGHNTEKATMPIGIVAEIDTTTNDVKILKSAVKRHETV